MTADGFCTDQMSKALLSVSSLFRKLCGMCEVWMQLLDEEGTVHYPWQLGVQMNSISFCVIVFESLLCVNTVKGYVEDSVGKDMSTTLKSMTPSQFGWWAHILDTHGQ